MDIFHSCATTLIGAVDRIYEMCLSVIPCDALQFCLLFVFLSITCMKHRRWPVRSIALFDMSALHGIDDDVMMSDAPLTTTPATIAAAPLGSNRSPTFARSIPFVFGAWQQSSTTTSTTTTTTPTSSEGATITPSSALHPSLTSSSLTSSSSSTSLSSTEAPSVNVSVPLTIGSLSTPSIWSSSSSNNTSSAPTFSWNVNGATVLPVVATSSSSSTPSLPLPAVVPKDPRDIKTNGPWPLMHSGGTMNAAVIESSVTGIPPNIDHDFIDSCSWSRIHPHDVIAPAATLPSDTRYSITFQLKETQLIPRVTIAREWSRPGLESECKEHHDRLHLFWSQHPLMKNRQVEDNEWELPTQHIDRPVTLAQMIASLQSEIVSIGRWHAQMHDPHRLALLDGPWPHNVLLPPILFNVQLRRISGPSIRPFASATDMIGRWGEIPSTSPTFPHPLLPRQQLLTLLTTRTSFVPPSQPTASVAVTVPSPINPSLLSGPIRAIARARPIHIYALQGNNWHITRFGDEEANIGVGEVPELSWGVDSKAEDFHLDQIDEYLIYYEWASEYSMEEQTRLNNSSAATTRFWNRVAAQDVKKSLTISLASVPRPHSSSLPWHDQSLWLLVLLRHIRELLVQRVINNNPRIGLSRSDIQCLPPLINIEFTNPADQKKDVLRWRSAGTGINPWESTPAAATGPGLTPLPTTANGVGFTWGSIQNVLPSSTATSSTTASTTNGASFTWGSPAGVAVSSTPAEISTPSFKTPTPSFNWGNPTVTPISTPSGTVGGPIHSSSVVASSSSTATATTTAATSGSFYCVVCNCALADSTAYLDHINTSQRRPLINKFPMAIHR
jgi:hypothetical protein